MIRLFSLAAAALCLSLAFAHAADKPSLRAQPPTAPFTWTGFYVGAHGALVSGETGIQDLVEYGFPSNWNVDGGAIGVQTGYNYQINSFVLGVEADYAYATVEGSGRGTLSYSPGTFFQTDMSSRVNVSVHQMLTLRPRIGAAFDRSLIYVTVGLVAADAELRSETIVTSLFGTRTYTTKDRELVYGWTVGAGLEHATTDKLSVKAEYLLVTLDHNKDGEKMDDNVHQGHFFRVGLNYRF